MANMEEIKKAKKTRRVKIRKAAKKANKTVAEYKAHSAFAKAYPEVEVPAETPEVKDEEAPAEKENLSEENEEAS